MSGNAAPIYSRVGAIGFGTVSTANTALDGTGGAVVIFTADATNGGRVERVIGEHLGTNTATVVRIFINNGSSAAVAANNALIAEQTALSNTISQVAASVPACAFAAAPFPLVLPPGYTLMATTGTTIAAGIRLTALAGAY